MRQEHAEEIGRAVLIWLGNHEDLFPVFLNSTGAAADEIARKAYDPEFLAAVLDFLLMDDVWVMAFCEQADLPPEHAVAARAALPGGGEVHWT